MTDLCALCAHPRREHMKERMIGGYAEGNRELCLECPGYEDPGYPRGKAWHRYRETTE